MNIDLKDLPAKLIPLLQKLKKYSVFICVLLVLSVYLFLVWQISVFSTAEPSSIDLVNKTNQLNTPKLDQDAVNKILLLEDQNVDIKTLFNQARQNPFQE